ncbi:MAG: hypothetical protein ACE5JU_15115 [Candidatus Binatia bacterium]
MVSWQDVEERLVELLGKDPPSDLALHLHSCPAGQEKRRVVGKALESYGPVGGGKTLLGGGGFSWAFGVV